MNREIKLPFLRLPKKGKPADLLDENSQIISTGEVVLRTPNEDSLFAPQEEITDKSIYEKTVAVVLSCGKPIPIFNPRVCEALCNGLSAHVHFSVAE